MTVLAKYQRLEAEGVWRANADAQRRDVIVSIGKATLTISDPSETALTHWSLPAMRRANPGQEPAIYDVGEEASDRLEVSDPEMVAALEKVLKAVRKGRAHPGRLRAASLASLTAAILGLGVFWLPGAVAQYTAAIVPDAARENIGQDLLAQVRRVAGAPCADPAGQRALVRLSQRLFRSSPARLVVLPSALETTAHLPGGIILIGHELVEDHETPEVLAGYLIAEDIRRSAPDPLAALLDKAGLFSALTLLTTGRLPETALRDHAERLIALPPAELRPSELVPAFAASDVEPNPYLRISAPGPTEASVIQASGAPRRAILSDGNWIALQQICED